MPRALPGAGCAGSGTDTDVEDLQLGACQFTGTEEKVQIVSHSTTADGTEEKNLKLILSTIGFCQSVLSASVLFQDNKTEIRRSFTGGKQQVIY